METYGRFLFEFLDQFFSGFKDIFIAIFNCIKNVFNFPEYFRLIQQYSSDFGIAEWMLTGLAILALSIVILSLNIVAYIKPKSAAPATPPIPPSIDFLGLSTGAILCLPNITPTRYAHVSHPHEHKNISHTIYAPSCIILT